MRRTVPVLALALVAGLAARPAAAAEKKVTLEGLLRQMTDLSQLAEFPDPPYVTRQFSSYDRASQDPKDPDGWFANDDRGFLLYDGVVKGRTPYYKAGPMQGRGPDGHFAAGTKVGIARHRRPIGGYVWAYATGPDGRPTDGKTPQGFIARDAITLDPQGHVLAEMDGPGCVVRIWSANPQDAGRLRIYLDGAKEPVINAPAEALLSGSWKTKLDGKERTPFPAPLAHEASRGYNLYFPILYARHCKITVEKPDIYYHVNYRTYPEGTGIEPFVLKTAAAKAGEWVGAYRYRQGQDLATEQFEKEMVGTVEGKHLVKPGGSWKAPEIKGPRVVTRIRVDAGGKPEHTAEVLRGLVLTATFDGAKSPQVWSPLGDFFGSGPGLNPFRSRPLQVRETGALIVHFPMPFEKSAVFEVLNRGKHPAKVTLDVSTSSYQWSARSLHFHAKWRTETMKTRPFRDWTFCDLKGKGVFVGDALSVLNPVGAWWGEGDEKVYVDGEKFPSWFGTGTEDYFGYAWCDPKPFQHAYHNQTRCDGPGNRGHTSVNRFHVLDAIPFTKSFRFDLEVWHWTENIAVTYAATSYWYARPGATDDFKPVEARVLQNLPSLPPPYRIRGAVEGERLKVLGKSGDFEAGPQDMAIFADGKWSGDSHLWVRPPKAGSWADLELPVAADGTYHVVVYLTKARDYGVLQFRLDGKALGKPIDCFHPDQVVSTGAIDLGTVKLKKGKVTLRGEVVGTNAKSVGLRYMWGLDCVVLRPAGK